MADAVAEILREDGIDVLLETDAAARRRRPRTAAIALTVRTPDGERTLDRLAPAGRRGPHAEHRQPRTWPPPACATDKHGFIQVNERLETNVPGIYALGDVKGGPAFTHISYDDFRILTHQPARRRQRDHDRTAWCPTPSSSTRSWAASA